MDMPDHMGKSQRSWAACENLESVMDFHRFVRPITKMVPATFPSGIVSCCLLLAGVSSFAMVPAVAELPACHLPMNATACGDAPSCAPLAAPEIPGAWHGLTQCLRSVRDVWAKQGPSALIKLDAMGRTEFVSSLARRLIVNELHSPHTKILISQGHKDVVVDSQQFMRQRPVSHAEHKEYLLLVNRLGVPYSGMGHGGLAYMSHALGQLAGQGGYSGAAADALLFRRVGHASARSLLRTVADGGLTTRAPCADDSRDMCAWYHSMTRTDRSTERGGTLNQHLHVVRDLGLVADLLSGQSEQDIDFNAAVAEGIRQLFRPKYSPEKWRPPVLLDFVSTASVQGISWFYYGFDTQSRNQTGGYFLNVGGKDCEYHIHDLDLLGQILARLGDKVGEYIEVSKHLNCQSELANAYRSARIRFESNIGATWKSSAQKPDVSCTATAHRYYRHLATGFWPRHFGDCEFEVNKEE